MIWGEFLGGGVLVSLCWDRGCSGCKCGYSGVVDVAYSSQGNTNDRPVVLTGGFGLLE
jgi:hypothetical protein